MRKGLKSWGRRRVTSVWSCARAKASACKNQSLQIISFLSCGSTRTACTQYLTIFKRGRSKGGRRTKIQLQLTPPETGYIIHFWTHTDKVPCHEKVLQGSVCPPWPLSWYYSVFFHQQTPAWLAAQLGSGLESEKMRRKLKELKLLITCLRLIVFMQKFVSSSASALLWRQNNQRLACTRRSESGVRREVIHTGNLPC